MLELVTLFSGLVTGRQIVEGRMGEAPVSLELRLDGRSLGTLDRPPWKWTIDLGSRLQPHRLTAHAYDERRLPLTSAELWINVAAPVPDPNAESRTPMVIRVAGETPSSAEIEAHLRVGHRPAEVIAVQEGLAEVVIVHEPAAAPFLVQAAALFLRYQLAQPPWLPPGSLDATALSSRDDFIEAVLTAFEESRPGPRSSHLLAVAAAERTAQRAWECYEATFTLPSAAMVRIMPPHAAPASRVADAKELFPTTGIFEPSDHGFLWNAVLAPPYPFAPRSADAVAVAASELHASAKRRAIFVFSAGGLDGEGNVFTADQVRGYAESLQVPVELWWAPASGPPNTAWGEVTTLDPTQGEGAGARLEPPESEVYVAALAGRLAALRRELGQQRIVWIEGRHLPDDIRLVGEGLRFSLVGGEVPRHEPLAQTVIPECR